MLASVMLLRANSLSAAQHACMRLSCCYVWLMAVLLSCCPAVLQVIITTNYVLVMNPEDENVLPFITELKMKISQPSGLAGVRSAVRRTVYPQHACGRRTHQAADAARETNSGLVTQTAGHARHKVKPSPGSRHSRSAVPCLFPKKPHSRHHLPPTGASHALLQLGAQHADVLLCC